MAKLNGTNMRVLANGVVIGASRSFTLNVKSTNIDTSSKDSGGWGERIYGDKDWDVSQNGLYDPALLFNVEEIYNMLNAKTSVVLEMAVIDGTGGGLVYRGTAIAGNLSIVANKGEAVTISCTFEATSALTQGTVATS